MCGEQKKKKRPKPITKKRQKKKKTKTEKQVAEKTPQVVWCAPAAGEPPTHKSEPKKPPEPNHNPNKIKTTKERNRANS